MPLLDETTSLLRHSEQDGHAVGPRSDVASRVFPAKDPAVTCTEADIEANEVDASLSDTANPAKFSTSSLIPIIAVLMIGLFTSNIDSSLVLAIHPRIASEFDALEESSWLFVSFQLGGIVTQVLYAKLSDLYGRRVMLIFCYGLFGTGCAMIGLSRSMWQVILGRVLSGSAASGMWSIGLILTTDLIPLRDVASWLGIINIVSTTGRSIGGPLGGFLSDRVGWRWSFSGQAPLFAIAMLAAIFLIPNTKAPDSQTANIKGLIAWFSRIDFAGSLLFGIGLLLCMLALEIGGVKVPWTHPIVFGLFGAGILTLGLFGINEARWAEEPAFPVGLIMNRDVMSPYIAICCISGAQTSLMYFVPLYFQVTSGVSNTIAGLHLVPAVVGNTLGGLAAGYFIRKTGGYKAVIIGSSVCGSIGYSLLVIRWVGDTNWWESMYIVLGGFGSGMSASAVFVSLNAVVEPAHKAVVTSGLNLAIPIGTLLGVTAGSAAMLDVIQRVVDKKLLEIGLDFESRTEIIRNSIANVDYIRQLPKHLEDIVVSGYIVGLRAGFGVILLISLTGLVAGFFLRQRRL
ncbi:major facilitator superfamily transporter [Astrocystis sublimbata]|nr:major facilitator superfamily transporter [Astrocystis sublimbata]